MLHKWNAGGCVGKSTTYTTVPLKVAKEQKFIPYVKIDLTYCIFTAAEIQHFIFEYPLRLALFPVLPSIQFWLYA